MTKTIRFDSEFTDDERVRWFRVSMKCFPFEWRLLKREVEEIYLHYREEDQRLLTQLLDEYEQMDTELKRQRWLFNKHIILNGPTIVMLEAIQDLYLKKFSDMQIEEFMRKSIDMVSVVAYEHLEDYNVGEELAMEFYLRKNNLIK